jgi:hypothetical protein
MVVTRAQLADAADAGPVAQWLGELARDIPDPPGDHGELQVTITIEWDHVRLGK